MEGMWVKKKGKKGRKEENRKEGSALTLNSPTTLPAPSLSSSSSLPRERLKVQQKSVNSSCSSAFSSSVEYSCLNRDKLFGGGLWP